MYICVYWDLNVVVILPHFLVIIRIMVRIAIVKKLYIMIVYICQYKYTLVHAYDKMSSASNVICHFRNLHQILYNNFCKFLFNLSMKQI